MSKPLTCNPFNRRYVQIDCNFILQQIGVDAFRFTDCPDQLKLGQDVRLSFPELIGLEAAILALEIDSESKLILEELSHFQDGETPFYFDLQIARSEDNPHYYWIGFEDSTQRTLNKQAILHHANIAEISITQLSSSKQYIDAILHSMSEALIVTDRGGKIKSLNPAAISFLGKSSEELIGQPISQILPLENFICRLDREEAGELVYETKTEGKQYFAFTCTHFQNQLATEQGLIYIGRNITPRKQAEIALQQANINLQKHNQDLNQLIEFNKVLNQCRTRLEVDQAISQFLPQFLQNWTGYLELTQASQPEEWQTLVAWGDSTRFDSPPATTELDSPQSDREVLGIDLVNQDQTLGRLHLYPETNLVYLPYQKQLAIALVEQMTLAIVNVTLHETLEAESIRDALTHLYNRRYLSKTLPEALKLAQQRQQSLCVVMLDVDYFKRFNDTWGHQAGDRVLEQVSSYLSQNIRQNDIAYRYGGEEFVIVLQNIEAAIAYPRIEQLRQGLRNIPIIEGDRTLYITASCGLSCFPQSGQTASQLLKAADLALYQAKAQGRDRVILADLESSA